MNHHLFAIYFSPTGSTKRVVKLAEKVFKEELMNEIDLCKQIDKTILWEDDLAIIAVPSYGGRVPQLAVDRLRRIQGNQTKAILVVTYGNRAYDDTLEELYCICEQQGLQVIAAIAAVCEHSIVHEYAKGRPDNNDTQMLLSFYSTILHERNTLKKLVMPIHLPWREYHGVSLKLNTSTACNRCGSCASLCPMKAIDVHDPSRIDHNLCISCMCCVSLCLTKARSVDSTMLEALAKKLEQPCSQRKENQLFINR